MTDHLQVAIPLFPKFTALDAVGPYEVLQRIPFIDVVFVGQRTGRGPQRERHARPDGRRHLRGAGPNPTSSSSPAAWAPAPAARRAVLEWVRHAHATTRFTTSVCTGSLVLGAAGLLKDLTATTHWSCYDELAATAPSPRPQRVVEHLDQRIITAAGVSSGIDMALRLVELLVDRTAAEAAQLMIEYDPQPPFDSGVVARVAKPLRVPPRRATGPRCASCRRRGRRRRPRSSRGPGGGASHRPTR
jgi:putative intracellular protease/amidase